MSNVVVTRVLDPPPKKKWKNKPLLEPNVDFVFVFFFYICGTIVCWGETGGNLIAKPKMRVEFAAFWISDFGFSLLSTST